MRARRRERGRGARGRWRGGRGGHGSTFPASQAACRSAVYAGSGKARRETVAQRAPVRGRHVDGGDAQRFDGVDALQHGAHVGIAFGVQQQARARLHAGDALHRIQRRAGLHHHELPADRAVVVGLPADAAEHRDAGRNTAQRRQRSSWSVRAGSPKRR